MSEITFSALKNSHQIREYEEKRRLERKRNLIYLIAQFLRDEGYFETLSAFSSEAQLSDSYQICDNIDLTLVLQDFESYYFVRFQKYPKICKKSTPDEGILNVTRKISKLQARKTGAGGLDAAAIGTRNVKAAAAKSPFTGEKKPPEESNCLSVVPIGPEGATQNTENNAVPKSEKMLKPLRGVGVYNAEWLGLAEMITKDIVMGDLNIRWSDIMGLDEPKRILKEAVVYPTKYPELFKGILTPWKGLLLFGPPGTGKTLLAKAAATECKTTFFNITATSIVSKWRGDSEKLVKVMFELARYHAPSTIFLDELDAVASKRDGSHHSSEHEASRRLKSELLIQLDGLSQTEDQIFFLATSNLPWELDPAMLRRLEKRILVDIPNADAREAMFKHYLPKVVLKRPLLEADILYEFLAKETEGYSGSDIKLVCKETAMQAVRSIFHTLENSKGEEKEMKLQLQTIKTEDVLAALDKTKPSASHLLEKYKAWQNQFGSI